MNEAIAVADPGNRIPKDKIVRVLMDAPTMEQLIQKAEAKGLSYSAFVRSLVKAAINAENEKAGTRIVV